MDVSVVNLLLNITVRNISQSEVMITLAACCQTITYEQGLARSEIARLPKKFYCRGVVCFSAQGIKPQFVVWRIVVFVVFLVMHHHPGVVH